MWAPTCKSDPGKVTDVEYHCTPDDAGGVHSNSGVPNHGFALLVDGGTYNGQTISAIGMVKAAHIYWQAQVAYQTPTSNFVDHADSLEAACSDLIGVNLESLSTGLPVGPSGEMISTADCAEVSDMIDAVELRVDPSAQCNFQPLLDPNTPALCADGPATTVALEDFEAGLGDWTLSNEGVFAGWPNLNWEHDTSLPGGRSGSAAFGPDPVIGNCDGGAGDVSGVMHMESPVITIPADGSARLAFDHYVATEPGWDGGNLKISVNGGPYTLVPSSAYTFNAYNTTLQPPPANTNPLAGQAGFSGTDGGSLTGSWGQSQIDLAAVGVSPGDTIRLQYDLGMDGCNGNDGWYVDDVHVYTCEEAAPTLDCSEAFARPSRLWPANGQFRSITVQGVTDPNRNPITITIDSIFQDEPVITSSDNTAPDGRGVGNSKAGVRGERVPTGNGRVYHISFTADNGVGGSCTGEVLVGVPITSHGTAVDDGALYDSTVRP
jgi:hypothetical protein